MRAAQPSYQPKPLECAAEECAANFYAVYPLQRHLHSCCRRKARLEQQPRQAHHNRRWPSVSVFSVVRVCVCVCVCARER